MSYDKQKLLRFQEAILEDADEKIARMNQNISNYAIQLKKFFV